MLIHIIAEKLVKEGLKKVERTATREVLHAGGFAAKSGPQDAVTAAQLVFGANQTASILSRAYGFEPERQDPAAGPRFSL